MLSASSNAALTKTRALYKKRLKLKDYKALASLYSVAEVAGYLKRNTYYRDAMAGIDEATVRRGQLELLLYKEIIKRAVKIKKFLFSDDFIANTLTKEMEIMVISLAIQNINLDESDNENLLRYSDLEESMSFDFAELVNATTFDELLEVLRFTPYFDGLREISVISKKKEEDINLVVCEIALKSVYYSEIMDVINKKKDDKNKQEFLKLIQMMIDIDNISLIYRLKNYFKYNSDEVMTYVIKVDGTLSKKQILNLVKSSSGSQVLSQLSRTRYDMHSRKKKNFYIENETEKIKLAMSRKMMRFSVNPPMVYMAYVTIQMIELRNIINTIEGVRYKIGPEEIEELIII